MAHRTDGLQVWRSGIMALSGLSRRCMMMGGGDAEWGWVDRSLSLSQET